MNARYEVNTKPSIDGEIVQTVDWVGVDGVHQTLIRQVIRTQDYQIRAALIQLGWTPPPGAPT